MLLCEKAQLGGRPCGDVAVSKRTVMGQNEMTKTFTILGLLVAFLLVAAGFLGLPGASLLQAQEEQRVEVTDPGANCRLVEVALDEGYGVSRRVVRSECSAIQ
jgi:predicted ATP-grasp superfamily ATP-dependent carboligase